MNFCLFNPFFVVVNSISNLIHVCTTVTFTTEYQLQIIRSTIMWLSSIITWWNIMSYYGSLAAGCYDALSDSYYASTTAVYYDASIGFDSGVLPGGLLFGDYYSTSIRFHYAALQGDHYASLAGYYSPLTGCYVWSSKGILLFFICFFQFATLRFFKILHFIFCTHTNIIYNI